MALSFAMEIIMLINISDENALQMILFLCIH